MRQTLSIFELKTIATKTIEFKKHELQEYEESGQIIEAHEARSAINAINMFITTVEINLMKEQK